ncbi:MAG: hypothetical protein WBR26_02420 [Candidatus Acidiferrum sp.]
MKTKQQLEFDQKKQEYSVGKYLEDLHKLRPPRPLSDCRLKNWDEDSELYQKVHRTIRPGQTPGEWFAEFGLGLDQVLCLSDKQIEAHCKTMSERNKSDAAFCDKKVMEEKGRVPRKIFVETF